MRKTIYFLAIAILISGLTGFVRMEPEAVTGFKESFTQTLKNAKTYTLEVAETMPAGDYTFRPHDSVRSFGEQLAHIGLSTGLINRMFIKGEEVSVDPAAMQLKMEELGRSKEDCLELLNESFDQVIQTIESMSEEDLQKTFVFTFAPNKPELTKEQGFLFLRDHVTHHRAQAIVYLRMRGHKAPPYRPF